MATKSKSPLDAYPEEVPVIVAAQHTAAATFENAGKRMQDNVTELKRSKTKEVSMAPMYAPWFGNIMAVGLNGLTIYLPLDGRTYKVPIQYAQIIQGRRRAVDDFVMRTKQMSNVQSNREDYAGQLVLLPK
jgi:hypothetical protein